MIKRIEWVFKITLGLLCYWAVMIWPLPWNNKNRTFTWLLAWAGFYAYDDGYKNWAKRSSC